MSDVYSIEATSDIIRGSNNLGTNHLIENLNKAQVLHLIEENNKMFGKPRCLAGMILWVNRKNDTFCFNIYKNNICLNILSLDDL
ncbi:MAG: hypothetical protein EBY39_13500 [Flavobacteriia bacterium]|nr:hypothetical protein [Flavobacteriia bacterium]